MNFKAVYRIVERKNSFFSNFIKLKSDEKYIFKILFVISFLFVNVLRIYILVLVIELYGY